MSKLPKARRKPKPPACTVRGCTRRPRAEGMCATHCKKEADRIFEAMIRASGPCVRCGTWRDLQCSHVVSRAYLATRWDPANAEPACRACHHWMHMHPLEAEREWEARLGYDYTLLKQKALAGGRPDYAVILPLLRARVPLHPDLDVPSAPL